MVGLRSFQLNSAISKKTPLFLLQSKRNFIKTIPQPPGYVVGGVNDATAVPDSDKVHGSRHWTSERLVSAALIPLSAVPLVTGSSFGFVDSILSSLLILHCHIGFQSCIIDYIPLRVYGVWHHYAMYLLTFGSLVSAYGVYQIEKKEEGGVSGIVKKLAKA
ncbi:hypothetical protein PACTADRAFT_38318 [Pachysolen tannophilus NRRL Y-2460]|uniref:Succinate dehydrogenase [ubiquinone] cytochrome b small subunit n=1 Tax=Pachysolen tannophilus NRRL Y-2460 TaxID=669874 RepID=A0A1E4U1L2_PACTA|nr:hypothetical protein PACTADRAFT_38318 [Pachysolen tannophilus NRRL Y-2460]